MAGRVPAVEDAERLLVAGTQHGRDQLAVAARVPVLRSGLRSSIGRSTTVPPYLRCGQLLAIASASLESFAAMTK